MRRLILLAACLLLAAPPARAQQHPLTILAAASLTDALRDAATAWQATGQPAPRLSFAASSALARQVENGAQAHIFASADLAWMDHLDRAGHLAPGTRRNLLGNTLVLIVPKTQARPLTLDSRLDVTALLGPRGRLATGTPGVVPVGTYARQALTSLGLWPAIAPRLANTEDVRGALMLVGRGEAPAGIVYATDAAASPDVAIAATFPASTHAPITYPFAVLKTGDTPQARAFLTFLESPHAQALFARHGFTRP